MKTSSMGRHVRGVVVAAFAAATITAVPMTAAAGAASDCSLTPTGGTITRTLDGRTYNLHVPQGLSGARVPLLLVLHGFGSTASQVEQYSGWSGFAQDRGFIVAYPQARPYEYSGAWDPYSPSSADVTFARDVVADIAAQWCVDPARVHIDGWSNGAVMSQRVACDAADVFASASSYAGGTPTLSGFGTPCRPTRPISVMLLAGQWDPVWFGLAQNTSEWRAVNGCSSTATRSTDQYGSTDTYACQSGTSVVTRTVNNTGHEWPSGAVGADQRARMWAFFTANPMGG
jgi:polyhydroxybutyrate depolymerase